jgi:cytidyltransferase-like protein
MKRYVKTFEGFIYEAVISEITEGEEVIFFPGRFQPFHNGHMAAMERASKEFGLPVIPLQILSAREESPFPDTLLEAMGKAIADSTGFLANYFIYPTGTKTVIPLMVKYLREQGYEPLGLACGSDRLTDYTRQVAYINSPKTDVVVKAGFEVKMVDARDSDGASGTKVRDALKEGDKKTFELMMPKVLWPYYDELKKYIA